MSEPKSAAVSPYITADEVADLLRTSRKAVYALAERGQLPGLRRFGRRMLVKREELIKFIEEGAVPSPGGIRR